VCWHASLLQNYSIHRKPISQFGNGNMFVKLFLYKSLGNNWVPLQIKGRLAKSFKRNKGHRFAMVLVRRDGFNSLHEIGFHGSAHVKALAHANALMEVSVGVTYLKEGVQVDIRLIL
jgi:molybdopterin biosynthesis enzyme